MRETLVTAEHLNVEERRWLFQKLWGEHDETVPRRHERVCGICGAAEGECVDETCIRTRVTNKLSLTKTDELMNKKPTIRELEAILDDQEGAAINILPSGEIRVGHS